MGDATTFMTQAFGMKRGRLQPMRRHLSLTEGGAIKKAEAWASREKGVAVVKVTVDADLGEVSAAVVLCQHGDVPDYFASQIRAGKRPAAVRSIGIGVMALSLAIVSSGQRALGQLASETPGFRVAPVTTTPKQPNAGTPAGAKKERRPGELEGWDSGLRGPVKTNGKPKPADAVGEKTLPDGGLPLPKRKLSSEMPSPLGFDKNGNMGSSFKF